MNSIWIFIGRIIYRLAWPLLFVYLRLHSTRTRVLMVAEGKVLLVKGWLGSGKWLLPGGGLHFMEDPAEGALREVEEETNIQLKTEQLEFLVEGKTSQDGLRFKFRAYVCKLPKTIPPTKQRFELVAAKWIPLREISKKTDVSPDTKQIIKAWLAKK